MAPLPAKALHRRGDNAGRTFSIIFAVIAFLVVLGCLIWGIILPRYRKRNIRRPPQRLAANRMTVCNARRFPSHPALLRGSRKTSSIALGQYDPRTESPFPHNPAQPGSSLPPPRPPPAHLLGAPTHSDGLFTPIKDRRPSRNGRSWTEALFFRSKKRVENEEETMPKVTTVQDYVLPIPEALLLKPRAAGRPPPLTKQLEMFPLPHGIDHRKGGLMHHFKLFQDMEQRGSKSVANTVGTPCPTPCKARCSSTGRSSILQVAVQGDNLAAKFTNHAHPMPTQQSNSFCARGLSLRDKGNEGLVTSMIPAVSITGTPVKQLPLNRTSGLSRSTAPASEIRELHDHAVTDERTESASFQQGHTPSTNPFTTPGNSSTPPTSSIVSCNTFPALPTPLPLPQPASATFVRASEIYHHQTPASTLPPPAKGTLPSHIFLSQAVYRTDTSMDPAQAPGIRPIAARPETPTDSTFQPRPMQTQRHSLSSFSKVNKPTTVPAKGNHIQRASSVYSRDTRGMSIVGNGAYTQTGHDNAKGNAQPWSSVGNHMDRMQPEADVTNTLKRKIDRWDLRTDHLNAQVLPPSVYKRSASDSGPRGAGLCDFSIFKQPNNAWKRDGGDGERQAPMGRTGRFQSDDDDVFVNQVMDLRQARALSAAKVVQMYRPEPVVPSGLAPGTAPGGAQWI
ncbi:hypothetical protein A1O1_05975 [Capronia coronata CBS 617.96]|uniref:Uncharacterized protein n=1 Tax=Capronia coronata CBS 617.96 TaxID=1182541 RepID=W9YTJ3_9EURO|nr:uncharacterized protein A1O1_05975 [Capronia coronata CBS 617.96]EXJ85609.1 hypothetical protein A1O1_05975 [Capronia coronata CBS 617.96]